MADQRETENRIIRAATDVFLEKGRDGARMQDIADRAGINKALLHYYFRSKNRLYEKVFESIVEFFLSHLLEAAQMQNDLSQMLRSFINEYIDTLARHPQVVRFVLWEIRHGGENFARAAKKVFEKHGYTTIPLIAKTREAVESGKIRPVDPVHFTLSLLGMCLYPFIARPIIERVIPGVEVFSPDFLRCRKEEVFHLVWEGIQPETKSEN